MQDLVGGHPSVCSKHILELIFNEPQLLLVFRVSLEIEMVYGLQDNDDDTAELPDYHNITGDDFISLEGEIPLSPDSVLNYNPTDEGNLRVQNLHIYSKVIY